MDRSELLQLTDIETIVKKYEEILGDRIYTDGTHTLYTRGLVDGMEIIISAIAESMALRKRITEESADNDK